MGQSRSLLEEAKRNNKDAIRQLEQLSNATPPNLIAINDLGVCYESGYGVTQDQNKAVTLYRRAADLGDDTAMCNLGLANQGGRGTPLDLSSAAYWYLESAKKNSTNLNGSRRAVQQLEELAKAEPPNTTVLNNLGVCYESGYGVAQDQNKAVTLYRRAADLGDDTAMCNLGLATQGGRGTPLDLSLAAYWYLESAKKNSTNLNGSIRAALQLVELGVKRESKHELMTSTKRVKTSTSANSEIQKQSSVKIQRVWRGYRARKEIALTLPSALTHSMKLKLHNVLPHFQREEIESKLFAIHSTDYFPTNGIIRVVDPKLRGNSHFRPTTHFALGELVRPHTEGKGNWENKKFAVVTPLKDLIPQLLNLNVYDTYILGDFKLTNDSIVLVPTEVAKKFENQNPGLKIVSYDPGEGLRHAVKSLIIKQGGYDIVTFANEDKLGLSAPAFLLNPQLYNLNTPIFFAPILRQRRNVAFGKHCCSLFGSSYIIGVVDNALTQLGFSPDYYGHVYNEDPAFSKLVIEYAIRKIENSSDFKSYAGSGVLKLHLVRARDGLQKIAVKSERNKNFVNDYTKARIARLLTWPDLFSFMQTDKRLALHIYNFQAFLCMYAFYRTCVIGEEAATKEGLKTIFSHNLNLLEDSMRIQVTGTIFWSRSNFNDIKLLPGSSSYLKELLISLTRRLGIAVNPSDNLEVKTDKVWKTLQAQQLLWLPTQIDLPDTDGNAPLIQALIARDEKKALRLLNAGANITNLYGRIPGWNKTDPLLTIALRHGMAVFAEALLKQSNYNEWDQLDSWQNTPLCDAIVMGLGNIATHLIKLGADVNRRPNYSNVQEHDLVRLAYRMGLTDVVTLLQEHGCISSNPPKRSCSIM